MHTFHLLYYQSSFSFLWLQKHSMTESSYTRYDAASIWSWHLILVLVICVHVLSPIGSTASQCDEVLQILSFCIGRGPLSQDLSRAHFILTYALPITPQLRGESCSSLDFASLLKQALHNTRYLCLQKYCICTLNAQQSTLWTCMLCPLHNLWHMLSWSIS